MRWIPPVLTLQDVAERVSGTLIGDGSAIIRGVSSIDDADEGDLVFAESMKYFEKALKSPCTAIIVPHSDQTVSGPKPLIMVENARLAFLQVLQVFDGEPSLEPGVHPSAVIGKEVTLGSNLRVGPNAVIGDHCQIGNDVTIDSGSIIGEGCVVGDGCKIYSNATVKHGTVLGKRVILHSNCVIGEDGFGYLLIGSQRVKVPQIGNVVLEDDVEVGAGSTIDRAKTGSTVIGARSKIDNLAHIAHNNKLGTDCVIVAQVGIAGSCNIGNSVIIAGQAGVKEHVTIHDNVTVLGRGAVFGDIDAGEVVSGYPARSHRKKMRIEAQIDVLPETAKRVKALEKTCAELLEQNIQLKQEIDSLLQRFNSLGEK